MAGWFTKKLQNGRVYMCIKETKWEIESASLQKRAIILALAQTSRETAFSEIPNALDMFDRPTDYTRENLMGIYNILEDLRIMNAAQIEATKKSMQTLGTSLPEYAIEHAKDTGFSINIWLCTLGAGITPDRRDDVREIWTNLRGAQSHLQSAFDHLRSVEAQTALMTGTVEEGVFGMIDDDDWIEWCAFVPSIFVKGIR